MKQIYIALISCLCSFTWLGAQNTVGLLSYYPSKSIEGYNLIFPHNQPDVFLLNNCGELVHTWPDDEVYRPGNTVHLLEDGRLLKAKRRFDDIEPEGIWAGGAGAMVELRSWDNELLWLFEQNDSLRRLHHAVEPMPNGNILMISWEQKSGEAAIAAGRDPDLLSQDRIWPDYLLEVDPDTDSVVWEWHAWDHLIQDYDPAEANYGDPAEHPELIDINYDTNDGHPDWMHVNAVDYNPELDQVMISVPTFSEVWVIDHSTTTEEAAGHTGGNSGRGGDLLYRWGNPSTYRQGSAEDQQLFYPHDLHWVKQPGYEGTIAAYNNRVSVLYSTAVFFTPEYVDSAYQYPLQEGRWGPLEADRAVFHPDTFAMNSPILSSVQVLPNDNLLICSGRIGYSVELTPDNEVVWEYITPLRGGSPVPQGTNLGISENLTFKMERYLPSYPAFEEKDLEPKGFIESTPNEDFCEQITSIAEVGHAPSRVKVFPNPLRDGTLQVEILELNERAQVEVFNAIGQRIAAQLAQQPRLSFDLSGQAAGLYYVTVNGRASHTFIIAE